MKLKTLFTAFAAPLALSACMEGGGYIDPTLATAAGAAIGTSLGNNTQERIIGGTVGALVGSYIGHSVPDCRTYNNTTTQAVRNNITGEVTYYITQQSQNTNCVTYGTTAARPIF